MKARKTIFRCMARRKKHQLQQQQQRQSSLLISQASHAAAVKKAATEKEKERVRKGSTRAKRRMRKAIEQELASGQESSDDADSASPGTVLRQRAITAGKMAKRLFSLAGALSSTKEDTEKKEASSSTGAGAATTEEAPGAGTGLQAQVPVRAAVAAASSSTGDGAATATARWELMEDEGWWFPTGTKEVNHIGSAWSEDCSVVPSSSTTPAASHAVHHGLQMFRLGSLTAQLPKEETSSR